MKTVLLLAFLVLALPASAAEPVAPDGAGVMTELLDFLGDVLDVIGGSTQSDTPPPDNEGLPEIGGMIDPAG